MNVAAIVPAAGLGRRLGQRTPKSFIRLGDRPLVAHALCVLQESPVIQWIILVVHEAKQKQARELVRRYQITKALTPCIGGYSRAESVAAGMAQLPRGARWVLIHDGARPCLSLALVRRAVHFGKRFGAVACGLPAMLTVKTVNQQGEVTATLKRDSLWFVQTPQVFRRDWFVSALEQADLSRGSFPDDAAILESAGFRVRMIPGDPLNLKVTGKEDLLLAQAILRSRQATCVQ